MDKSGNQRLLGKLVVIALAMFCFGFALVPFYEKICEVTGINNVTKADEVENTQVDRSRAVKMTFDTNIRDQLPVTLKGPAAIMINPGGLQQVEYTIENLSQETLKLQAIPSYGPTVAAQHFKKLECFCFKQQVLQPGEKRTLPVVFVVDTGLPAEVKDLTLSYTLFKVAGAS